jgi:DNA-binding transcriptional MerR regulator/effector-binding domain-containing protein
MSGRVTIGDFSRASHLSVKTLRHYHEVGLLQPSEVDPGNGYRYYSERQIPQAQVIRRLRGLQMPVAEVRAVLATDDPQQRNRLIVTHLDRLEAELDRTRAAVGELRDLLERPDGATAVEHRSVPPTPAVAIEATVARGDVLAWWQGALGELHASARAQGLTPAGPSGGLYAGDLFQSDAGHATVFLPIAAAPDGDAPDRDAPDGESTAIREIGRVRRITIPAAELAVARHDGPLADIDLTYGELGAYVMRHEIGVDGPLREHYLRGLIDTDDDSDWVTEIGWPIFRSDPSA